MKSSRWYFIAAIFIFLGISLFSVFAASDLEEGIKELSQQISKNMEAGNKKKIAIVEFSDLDGNVTAFGQFMAEELITQLFITSPGQFEVVERRQLMKVLNEQSLTMTGLLDAKAMESVGKILGIDAIVTGSITDLGNDVKVNARMIGVDTAKVFAVAATKIPKVGTVKDLLEKQAASVQMISSSGEQKTFSSATTVASKPANTQTKIEFATVAKLLIPTSEDISKRAKEGKGWNSNYESYAKALLSDYNSLVKKAKNNLTEDIFVKSLEECSYVGYPESVAGTIYELSTGLTIYLTSSSASKAFQISATSLAERSNAGRNWNSNYSSHANNLVEGYNLLLRESKSVFNNKNQFIQSLESVKAEGPPSAIASRIANLADELAQLMASLEK